MNIINDIKMLLENKDRVVVAIDGQSGSGKSTLSEDLVKELGGLLVHMDDYFLPPKMKTKERLSQSGGNVHFERLKSELLINLDQEELFLRKYNCMSNELEETQTFKNKKLIIIEGVYSLHKELRDFYDYKILLKVSLDVQLQRIEKRSGSFMLKRFIKEWIPLENHYFETEKLENISDVILEN